MVWASSTAGTVTLSIAHRSITATRKVTLGVASTAAYAPTRPRPRSAPASFNHRFPAAIQMTMHQSNIHRSGVDIPGVKGARADHAMIPPTAAAGMANHRAVARWPAASPGASAAKTLRMDVGSPPETKSGKSSMSDIAVAAAPRPSGPSEWAVTDRVKKPQITETMRLATTMRAEFRNPRYLAARPAARILAPALPRSLVATPLVGSIIRALLRSPRHLMRRPRAPRA